MFKFSRCVLCFFTFFVFSLSARADVYTHTIGTTGYMLREATQAHAYHLAKEIYLEALAKQKAAKQALKSLDRERALQLTKEAYDLAKQARDEALRQPKPDLLKLNRCPSRVKAQKTAC